jgi:hypothetical protein
MRESWLEREWNNPNRSDYYLLLIAQILCSIPAWIWGKDAKLGDLDELKIPFEFKRKETEDPEEIGRQMIEQSKRAWGAVAARMNRGR